MEYFIVSQKDGSMKVNLTDPTTFLGRGDALGINDQKCSRKQVEIRVGASEKAQITPHGVNPSFLKLKREKESSAMEKGKTYTIEDGDSFSLLGDDYWWTFHCKNPKKRNSDDDTVMNLEGDSVPKKLCFYGTSCTRRQSKSHVELFAHSAAGVASGLKKSNSSLLSGAESSSSEDDISDPEKMDAIPTPSAPKKEKNEIPKQPNSSAKVTRSDSPPPTPPSPRASSSPPLNLKANLTANKKLFYLAFPSFSTATYQFDTDKAARTATKVISEFLKSHPSLPIQLLLVDITDSETIQKFKKYYQLGDPRFSTVVGDLTNLRKTSSYKEVEIIANATNKTFSGGGGGINRAIHDVCPELESITKKRYKDPKIGLAYPVTVPSNSKLYTERGVKKVIHILGPNFNPQRPDDLKGDYVTGCQLLESAYKALLGCFLELIGLSSAGDKSLVSPQTGTGHTSKSAFDVLMSGKKDADASSTSPSKPTANKPAAKEKGEGGGAGGGWANALASYVKNPEAHKNEVYEYDDTLVVIHDKYPKAKHHFLVMPRKITNGFSALSPSDVGLIKAMKKKGEQIAQKLRDKDSALNFRVGFHAVPSMIQLHMHVISTDFNSDALKNKKHWNSFTTTFFIDAADFLKMLETQGAVKFDKHKYEAMLADEMKCPICDTSCPTIPKMKAHYQSCLKK